MVAVAAIVREGLSDPLSRLPLAGTRIAAERCGWRPNSARPSSERTDHASGADPRADAQAQAQAMDRQACPLACLETRYRLIQARLVAELLKRHLWRPLGFTRLSDYAAECLGNSARTVEEDARVVTALETLPAIAQAFAAGAIRWTHVRMLASIATAQTERGWLRLALTSTTRALAGLIKGVRRGDVAPGNDAGPNACAPGGGASAHAASAEIDAEDPLVRWAIVTTRGGRKLWRTVVDLAARMSGADVSAARVAEAVAAEAMSWPHCDPPSPPPPPHRPMGDPAEAAARAFQAAYGTCEGFDWVEPRSQSHDSELQHLLLNLTDADAHELDARLRTVRAAMQRIDAQLGAVLRSIAEAKAHQVLGFANLRLYAEARLGICGSKALALVKLERDCEQKSPLLMEAYRQGRITWLAATALLRVISRRHEREWVERGQTVTLRRLRADISWALDRADDKSGEPCQPPPPLDLDVTADAQARIDAAEVQMRAHTQADLGSFSRRVGAVISFAVPTSVAALLDDAIEGCRRAIEPRWRGFERIIAHAYLTWTSLPPHENPVFARDSHRCQVPGCTRRGPLHAHHVWFRSHGGPDDAWNLVAVCDEHHQLIHLGRIRVQGRAPDGLVWEMGCRPGKTPLMRLRGDVYLHKRGTSDAR